MIITGPVHHQALLIQSHRCEQQQRRSYIYVYMYICIYMTHCNGISLLCSLLTFNLCKLVLVIGGERRVAQAIAEAQYRSLDLSLPFTSDFAHSPQVIRRLFKDLSVAPRTCMSTTQLLIQHWFALHMLIVARIARDSLFGFWTFNASIERLMGDSHFDGK